MQKINPFSFDTIASGENFCDREKEIEELLGDIRSSHNIILYSQRRYGKTSLIKKALDLAKQEGFLTIYADIYHVLNEKALVGAYAKALTSAMDGSIEKILKTLKTIFTSLRPKITIDDEGKPEFTFGMESGSDHVLDLEEVFQSVNKYIRRKHSKAAIVFDEFQQIGQLQHAHRVESIIRSSIQEHKDISYIFMGSKKHLIFDLFSDPSRPLYGSGKMFPLKKIPPEYLSEFVYSRFRLTGKKIAKELTNELVSLCESHPYYTQYVSHSLWELALPKKSITEKDLRNALSLTINRISPRYEGIWELLPLRQKQSLIALAKIAPDEKVLSADVIQKFGLLSGPSFRKALQGLMEKGLVDRDKKRYSIIDIFFKKWIQENFPSQR